MTRKSDADGIRERQLADTMLASPVAEAECRFGIAGLRDVAEEQQVRPRQIETDQICRWRYERHPCAFLEIEPERQSIGPRPDHAGRQRALRDAADRAR